MTDIPTARPGTLDLQHDASFTYRYIAPPGHTLEHCSHPEYFRHNERACGFTRSGSKNAWNKIEIIAEDGSWEADLRILSVANGLVETRVIRHWETQAKPGRKPSVPDGYKVEHIQDHGWRALDRFGEPIVQKQPTEDKALAAAIDHNRRAKGNS